MNPGRQIVALVALLVIAGVSLVWYKHQVLGFPLLASESQTLWKIEATLKFDALGGPVTASINLPDAVVGRSDVFTEQMAPGYQFAIVDQDNNSIAQWRHADPPEGAQVLYLRSEIFFNELGPLTEAPAPVPVTPHLIGLEARGFADARQILAAMDLEPAALVETILREINSPQSAWLGLLLRDRSRRADKVQLAADLLAFQGIAARVIRGVELIDRQRGRSARFMLKVWQDNAWQLYDAKSATALPWTKFIEFQQGEQALFEVFGGEKSELSFAVVSEERAAFVNAVENARNHSSWLVDFSIYSLPVAQQSTFKLLLLIPLGALVVVILRNLVGIRTSGTFMPILIALSFLQTSLLPGLMLFLLVVGTGLLVRSYMSRLNLLLVPRIAAVLVFVIILYAAIGIAAHKLGFDWGAKVTFFPMIILSWTIERMSILWDEDGAREVFIQGGGSLVTASVAYLLMNSQTVSDAIFLYPEMLLIVLAIIIAIGSYSGYRLSDLRRFQPMERY
ncbi:hypothetical protein EYC98_11030 [Halieaceae bacterium IMCC14734]|uniref:Gonadoliberin III n=1 Tax=Candidatus Litorirhabdus singularis TaxID=2518993 RepID=A0ABT3TGG1_9GAMM|nr:UUP1 family membrane protein [Candidatus Litorirhabdus singularis]MCX2981397.1 hypothetical protein [Candidatus Litorirhabdus singularis]